MKVYVNVENSKWNKYKIDFKKIAQAAIGAVYKDSEVSITLIDDKQIHRINKQYRGIDKPTNVLSFELGDDILLGDIFISIDTVVREAKAANISASVVQGKDESFFDAETGTLHLKGYVRNSSASDGIILPDGASREAVENIVAEEGTVLPENCHCLFYGFSNILSVDLKNADASDVTDMSGMFSFNTAPKYIDAKEYNNPWYDFWKADVPWLERIVKIDVAGLDTGKVTNMSGMFSDIYIEPLDLSSFDTSNVTNMYRMF